MQCTNLAPRTVRRSIHADRLHTPLTERTGPWNRCHLKVPRLARRIGRTAPRAQRIIGAVLASEHGRRRAICAAALALIGVYSFAFVPAEPSLLGRHPVRLEALSASTEAMIAGGAFARVGKASLELALLAPLPTLLMAGPFLWWAGRLWGPEAAAYLGGRGPRGRPRVDRAVRALQRYGSWAVVLAYVLPVPSALIYAAAGWTGMRLRRFFLLDLAGTSLWAALNVGLGYALGRSAVHVTQAIAHYSLLLTLLLGVAVLAAAGLYLRRARTRPTLYRASEQQQP
jgi:membrane protein DedA with SNARE-associated domain